MASITFGDIEQHFVQACIFVSGGTASAIIFALLMLSCCQRKKTSSLMNNLDPTTKQFLSASNQSFSDSPLRSLTSKLLPTTTTTTTSSSSLEPASPLPSNSGYISEDEKATAIPLLMFQQKRRRDVTSYNFKLQEIRKFESKQFKFQRFILFLCFVVMAIETLFYGLIPYLPTIKTLNVQPGGDFNHTLTGSLEIMVTAAAAAGAGDAATTSTTASQQDQVGKGGSTINNLVYFWFCILLPKCFSLVVTNFFYTSVVLWFSRVFFRGILHRFQGFEEDEISSAASKYFTRYGLMQKLKACKVDKLVQYLYRHSLFFYSAMNGLYSIGLLVATIVCVQVLFENQVFRLGFIGVINFSIIAASFAVGCFVILVVSYRFKEIEYDAGHTIVVVRRMKRIMPVLFIILLSYFVIFCLWLSHFYLVQCLRLRFPFQDVYIHTNLGCPWSHDDRMKDANLTLETLVWFLCYQVAPILIVASVFRPIKQRQLHLIYDGNAKTQNDYLLSTSILQPQNSSSSLLLLQRQDSQVDASPSRPASTSSLRLDTIRSTTMMEAAAGGNEEEVDIASTPVYYPHLPERRQHQHQQPAITTTTSSEAPRHQQDQVDKQQAPGKRKSGYLTFVSHVKNPSLELQADFIHLIEKAAAASSSSPMTTSSSSASSSKVTTPSSAVTPPPLKRQDSTLVDVEI